MKPAVYQLKLRLRIYLPIIVPVPPTLHEYAIQSSIIVLNNDEGYISPIIPPNPT